MRDLVLPLEFARAATVYGGSDLSLKLVLAALDRLRATHGEEPPMESETGGRVVRVSLPDVVAMTQGEAGQGTTAGVIRRAALTGMTAQWFFDGEPLPEVPLVEGAIGGMREQGASIFVELTGAVVETFAHGPDLRIPTSDLRGVTTRCGVLLLLRGYAALAERREPRPVREQLYSAACTHYTGYRDVAARRPPSLRDAVEDHLTRGAAEVNATSAGLRVTVEPKLVRGGRGNGSRSTRYEHVDLTFDHPRATRRRREQVEAAQVDEAA